MEAHGLIPVARISDYKGMIFATFDQHAPALDEYLGDMAWYLDMAVDRRAGGIEFLPGTHKFRGRQLPRTGQPRLGLGKRI
jgi:phenylpropionate dioxygenase-like ring-hydroxylating dioxygenase large terminal subunit